MTASIVLTPILIAIIIIPIIIGTYVYRDANKRGMNAVLWTLVAIFAPSLIGFIIYLLVRGNYSNLKCPQCFTSVTEEYVICPKCGVKLRPACPNCNAPVENDWKLCPKCTQPLPEHYENIVTPQRSKDKTLWKILIAVILIPILLIAVLSFGFTAYTGGNSFSAMSEVTLEELYSVQESSYVKNWIESLDDDESKAYALQYANTSLQNDYQYYYILYVPQAGSEASYGLGTSGGGLFADNLKVEFWSGNNENESVYCINTITDKKLNLEVYCNNEKLDCEVIEIDFNPIPENISNDIQVEKVVEY